MFPGVQGGPLMHIIAAKAVCFKEAASPEFAAYQKQIVKNAARLAAALQPSGFRIVSGGTDNHIVLVDVFSKGITGKVAEAALGQAGITVNKNAIPFDQNPPMVASGVRLGTPAVTTRGMGEAEMDQIAGFITRVLAAPDDACVARHDQGAKSKNCAGSSRSTRNAGPEGRGRRGVCGRRATGRAPSNSSSRAKASAIMAGGRRRRRWPVAACCSPKPGPAPARRSPTSCRRSSAGSAC